MKERVKPFDVQVRLYANLFSKFWRFSVIILFLFLNSIYAQEVKSQEPISGLIVTSGDAVIYSKDPSFNEQISKSTSIQQYSKVIKINDNELKVIAKNAETPTKKPKPNIEPEVDLLAAKKLKDNKKIDFPKKKINLRISNGYKDGQFLAGASSGNGSFVPPANDYQHSKYFLIHSGYSDKISLEFLYFTDCLYKNDNSKLQINISGFSVRPPPSDLI